MKTKTTNQHTPGPWISTGYEMPDYEVPHFKVERDLRDRHGFVRDVLPLIAKVAFGDETTMAANARLIAAAPELLKACELALIVVTREVRAGRCPSGVENAMRQAIAKATGQTVMRGDAAAFAAVERPAVSATEDR